MNHSCISLASVYSKSEYHLHDFNNVDLLNDTSELLSFIRPQNYRRSNSNNTKTKSGKKDKLGFSKIGSALLITLGFKKPKKENKESKSVKQLKRKQINNAKEELQKTKLFVDLINLNNESAESSPHSTTSSSSPSLENSFNYSTPRLNQLVGSIMNLSMMQNDEKVSSAWNLLYECNKNENKTSESNSATLERDKKYNNEFDVKKNTELSDLNFDAKIKAYKRHSSHNDSINNVYKNIYANIYKNIYKSDLSGLNKKDENIFFTEEYAKSLNGNLDGNNEVPRSNKVHTCDSNNNNYESICRKNEIIAKKKQLKIKLRQNNAQNRLSGSLFNKSSIRVLKNDSKSSNFSNCLVRATKKETCEEQTEIETNCLSKLQETDITNQMLDYKNSKQEDSLCSNGCDYDSATIYANISYRDRLYANSVYNISEQNGFKKRSSLTQNSENLRSNDSKCLQSLNGDVSSFKSHSDKKSSMQIISKSHLSVFSLNSSIKSSSKYPTKSSQPTSTNHIKNETNALDSCFTDSCQDFSSPITFSNYSKKYKPHLQPNESDSIKLCSVYRHLTQADPTVHKIHEKNKYSPKENDDLIFLDETKNCKESDEKLHKGSMQSGLITKYNLTKYLPYENAASKYPYEAHNKNFLHLKLNLSQKTSFDNRIFYV